MVIIPFCCQYQPRCIGIFNLNHLFIYNGLAASWGPYFDHVKLLYKTFKNTGEAVHKLQTS